MKKYLLDTCVLSECARKKPDPAVVAWLGEAARDGDFFVSAVSIGEIAEGIESLEERDPRRRRLSDWFEREILQVYRDCIVDFDRACALAWGRIKGETNRNGRTRPDLDAQIAATARVHGMTVVTRNVDDMAGTGVKTVDPFREATPSDPRSSR